MPEEGAKEDSMPQIEHVFVLMLENRSFDHMLGYSGITGTDAVTHAASKINGLTGTESNSWNGTAFPATSPAVDPMKADPYHEFSDVLKQLCGQTATYPSGGPYPSINNSGFVSNFALDAMPKQPNPGAAPGDVMKCFDKAKLPVLIALAEEFAVCDSWFCSLPGPTWPNRFFALGASSADLDHSPTTLETVAWQTFAGFKFQNGSIFDANGSFKWRIYAGNKIFTLAHALKGIHIWDVMRYSKFASDVQDPSYPAQFTWIEPNYGHVTSDYLGGNSQHPLDGITGGEALIKATYEAIRNSPLWESSMLIITWDEHGGFYDHVAPSRAISPGDVAQFSGANQYGFRFDQYGPRVPAVVISPLIPRNVIDHREYDHTSVLATVERLFGLRPLTERDRSALDLLSLASLPIPRPGTPTSISLQPETELVHRQTPLDTLEVETPAATRENEPIENTPNLPGFVYVAGKTDMELKPPELVAEAHAARVRDRTGGIRTRGDARAYFEEVRRKTLAAE
jgi:phospholipase C